MDEEDELDGDELIGELTVPEPAHPAPALPLVEPINYWREAMDEEQAVHEEQFVQQIMNEYAQAAVPRTEHHVRDHAARYRPAIPAWRDDDDLWYPPPNDFREDRYRPINTIPLPRTNENEIPLQEQMRMKSRSKNESEERLDYQQILRKQGTTLL